MQWTHPFSMTLLFDLRTAFGMQQRGMVTKTIVKNDIYILQSFLFPLAT